MRPLGSRQLEELRFLVRCPNQSRVATENGVLRSLEKRGLVRRHKGFAGRMKMVFGTWMRPVRWSITHVGIRSIPTCNGPLGSVQVIEWTPGRWWVVRVTNLDGSYTPLYKAEGKRDAERYRDGLGE